MWWHRSPRGRAWSVTSAMRSLIGLDRCGLSVPEWRKGVGGFSDLRPLRRIVFVFDRSAGFTTKACLEILGANNDHWRAWTDSAHAQRQSRGLLGAKFDHGSRSQPLIGIARSILTQFAGDFPNAATHAEWHERQLKSLVSCVNNQATRPVKSEQSLTQRDSDLTTRSNHTVQALDGATPAPL